MADDLFFLDPHPSTRESLARDLRALGLCPGGTVLVHTSLRSLRWTIGGPVALVQALMDVLTPEGTLIMPTHSADLSDPAPWQNPPVPPETWPLIRAHMPAFDLRYTPTRGMGATAEVFRTFPDVRRSDHPTVSFAAWGRQADRVTAGHTRASSLGEGSPLARLYDLDGQVLLLGVSYDRNTSFHLAEYRVGANQEQDCASPVFVEEERVWATYRDILLEDDTPGRSFPEIGAAFEASGNVTLSRVGKATARLFSQRAAVDFAARWIADWARQRPQPGRS